ncbi:hypothetical protein, partial [Pseudomonas viridiflava]|uniref:hypothetical protein n=1 Tax=Pseudomonas viridiflava TaxID=33069 RepID=UPI00197DDE7B
HMPFCFGLALSRSKQRAVGGGLPVMNDDAIFLKHRIAGKPPPTRKNSASSVVCGSFDKR